VAGEKSQVVHGARVTGDRAAFARFDDNHGRFVPTWNWRAFIFGGLWYFRQGMGPKGGLLVAATFVSLVLPLEAGILLSVVGLVYAGLFGNYDHYLLTEKHTQWWNAGLFSG
jgi:hypothetical protein